MTEVAALTFVASRSVTPVMLRGSLEDAVVKMVRYFKVAQSSFPRIQTSKITLMPPSQHLMQVWTKGHPPGVWRHARHRSVLSLQVPGLRWAFFAVAKPQPQHLRPAHTGDAQGGRRRSQWTLDGCASDGPFRIF